MTQDENINRFYAKTISGGRLERIPYDPFLEFVRRRLTFHSKVRYTIERIEVQRILPMCNFVFESRIQRAIQLVDLYQKSGVDLFEPANIYFSDSTQIIQLLAPPVIEDRSGQLVLCDGMHRIFVCRQLLLRMVYVLMVRNVKLPLPGRLNRWENIRVTEEQKSLVENFNDFNASGFSGYTSIFNSEECWQADPLVSQADSAEMRKPSHRDES